MVPPGDHATRGYGAAHATVASVLPYRPEGIRSLALLTFLMLVLAKICNVGNHSPPLPTFNLPVNADLVILLPIHACRLYTAT